MIEITLEFAVFLFIVQFCSYFVKGLAGFGDPLISNPLLSMSDLQNATITPMNLLMNWPLNLYIAFKNRKAFSISSTIPMILCNLCGMVPGVILVESVGNTDSWIVKAALGILIIFCGVEMWTRKEEKTSSGNFLVMALVSLASGFTAGLYGINLFFVAYIERTGYVNRQQFRGQMCFIFFIENTVRLLLYFVRGTYTVDIFKLAVISALGVIGGMFLGSRVDLQLSEKTVRKIIIVVFICAGISNLVKAVLPVIMA